MIIYNVTIKVDNEILDEWLVWIAEHMPQVVATGCFERSSFFELLEPRVDEHRTFVAQYMAKTQEDYQRYVNDFAPKMREEGMQKFGEKFVAFRSILKKMD